MEDIQDQISYICNACWMLFVASGRSVLVSLHVLAGVVEV